MISRRQILLGIFTFPFCWLFSKKIKQSSTLWTTASFPNGVSISNGEQLNITYKKLGYKLPSKMVSRPLTKKYEFLCNVKELTLEDIDNG